VNEYDWSFVGADIDNVALASAAQIVEKNAILKENVEIYDNYSIVTFICIVHV
jgi:23S rRNA A1618 N6-methylase RlmF